MEKRPQTVDAYLAAAPSRQRAALETLRRLILAAAPDVVEGMAWGEPWFSVDGQRVAGFAICKDYLSFAPWQGWPGLIEEPELADIPHTARTLRFTPDHPLPERLIVRLVQGAIGRNAARRNAARPA